MPPWKSRKALATGRGIRGEKRARCAAAARCVVSAHRDGLYKAHGACSNVPSRVAQQRLVAEAGPVAIDGRVATSGGAAAYSAALLQRHALFLQQLVELHAAQQPAPSGWEAGNLSLLVYSLRPEGRLCGSHENRPLVPPT